MQTSQDRILTTHVGSLPRPPELRRQLVAKDQGEAYDKAELGRLTRQAVFGKLDPDISFKKLRAMAEGAAIASHRLWPGR